MNPDEPLSPVMAFVNSLGDHLANVAGIEKPREWNARAVFADVTKQHADKDNEAYFTVGTAATNRSRERCSWTRASCECPACASRCT